jgi:glycosyltransferase involved in cell wall biosynthesis
MLRGLTKSESDVYHIHSHLYFSSNQAVLAKILQKRKALLHIHGGVGLPPYKVSCLKIVAKKFYDRSLGKFTVKNSDLISSVSRTDLKTLAEDYCLSENRLRYIPNLVDTDIFKPGTTSIPGKKTLLYLGDLEPWKGVGSLIQWIRNKNWSDYKFRLRLVGQGSYLPNLLDLQRKGFDSGNGVSMDVIGPKTHNEIPAILQEASALVLPSYWEGMPTVILEAMAAGIPVISTRVGDVPYIIRHRETGFLIDRTFSSFQEAVKSVLNDHSLIRSITRNARNLVEQEYSMTHVQRITYDAYCEIVT